MKNHSHPPLRLLYGTGNPGKLAAMRNRLKSLPIQLIGLNDLNREIPSVPETGTTALENARLKALAYYEAFRIPVFSCDSGLYFDGVPEEDQPGIHVRTIGGKYLTDEEMLEHYSALAKKYGNLTARYRNAICLVLDGEHRYEAMRPDMESEPFLITSKPHEKRKAGFPIDSLSLDLKTGRYFYDLEEGRLDQVAVEEGFLRFFEEVLAKI